MAPDKVKLANLGSKKDGELPRPCEMITELSCLGRISNFMQEMDI